MKRPQTKFLVHTMSDPKFLGQKSQNLSLGQNSSSGQNYLATQFLLSTSILYWNYNNRYWYAFASL